LGERRRLRNDAIYDRLESKFSILEYRTLGEIMAKTAPRSIDTISREDVFIPAPQMWVRLRDRPTPYSDDEALLLCETQAGEWIAWVGDYGQIRLQRGDFFRRDYP
jgi:hypothetical protein